MLTLEINKNKVERACLVKETNFLVFLCTAIFNFTKPHLLKLRLINYLYYVSIKLFSLSLCATVDLQGFCSSQNALFPKIFNIDIFPL